MKRNCNVENHHPREIHALARAKTPAGYDIVTEGFVQAEDILYHAGEDKFFASNTALNKDVSAFHAVARPIKNEPTLNEPTLTAVCDYLIAKLNNVKNGYVEI